MKEIEIPVKVKIKAIKDGIKVIFKSKVGEDQAVSLADSLIENLKKGGYQVIEPKTTENKEAVGESEPAIPICPTHNKQMVQRQGQYGNFWTCPTKLEDGTWCKQKPPKK